MAIVFFIRLIPQHWVSHEQSGVLQRAYIFRFVIFPTIYNNKKIIFETTSPTNSKNRIDLNTGAFDISLNMLPNKLRLPEKVSTIAAKMLKTAISSV